MRARYQDRHPRHGPVHAHSKAQLPRLPVPQLEARAHRNTHDVLYLEAPLRDFHETRAAGFTDRVSGARHRPQVGVQSVPAKG